MSTTAPATVWPTTPDGRWLVLRTCAANMASQHDPNFIWPTEGRIEAHDWDPDPLRGCGRGLHGLLWGCGDAGLLSLSSDARWLVVAVDPADVADPNRHDKVRFGSAEVVYVGDRDGATGYLYAHGAAGLPVAFGSATAGGSGTATAGHYGTATAGDYGTATAGGFGTATAGDYGTATAGDSGTATAGDSGTATAGDSGTATAGHYGTATAGDYGTATAGDYGTLVIAWYDGARRRLAVGYVGEDGITADTPYKLDGSGQFVEVAA